MTVNNNLIISNQKPLIANELLNEPNHSINPNDLIQKFRLDLQDLSKDCQIDWNSIQIELSSALDCSLQFNRDVITISPMFLLRDINDLPQNLRPNSPDDPRLDTESYWQDFDNWFCQVFNSPPSMNFNDLIPSNKDNLILLAFNPSKIAKACKEHFTSHLKRFEQHHRLYNIVKPIMQDINFNETDSFYADFSTPIDKTMARANDYCIEICPLFVADLNKIPEDIRPNGPDDPKLYDLTCLQKLSDWIAEEYGLQKQKVGVLEIAAIKTILKVRMDPSKKALKAGLVHELGHVVLKHSGSSAPTYQAASAWGHKISILTCGTALTSMALTSSLSIGGVIAALGLSVLANYGTKYGILCSKHKDVEREADLYAVKMLKDGAEGVRLGFTAWRESLKELRSAEQLSLKDRLFINLLTTPSGELIPLFFTHGSFADRIQRAEKAARSF